jgi:hypothetical protein
VAVIDHRSRRDLIRGDLNELTVALQIPRSTDMRQPEPVARKQDLR